MNQDVAARLLPLVEEYAVGRAAQKALWREIAALRCHRAGEGVASCYHERPDDPCPPCAAKGTLYVRFFAARAEGRRRRVRIEALGLRLSLPDAPPGPPEPKPLLDLMGGDDTTAGGVTDGTA